MAIQIGVLDLVDKIWISDAVGSRKPGAGIFAAALEHAELEPDQAVFVGDSLTNDIAGANSAGLLSVLIDPAGAFDPSAAEVLPAHVIASIPELLQILRVTE